MMVDGFEQALPTKPKEPAVDRRPRKAVNGAEFGGIWAIEGVGNCRDLRLIGGKSGNFVGGVEAALSSASGL